MFIVHEQVSLLHRPHRKLSFPFPSALRSPRCTDLLRGEERERESDGGVQTNSIYSHTDVQWNWRDASLSLFVPYFWNSIRPAPVSPTGPASICTFGGTRGIVGSSVTKYLRLPLSCCHHVILKWRALRNPLVWVA